MRDVQPESLSGGVEQRSEAAVHQEGRTLEGILSEKQTSIYEAIEMLVIYYSS